MPLAAWCERLEEAVLSTVADGHMTKDLAICVHGTTKVRLCRDRNEATSIRPHPHPHLHTRSRTRPRLHHQTRTQCCCSGHNYACVSGRKISTKSQPLHHYACLTLDQGHSPDPGCTL
eukprot:355094-Chlamydomonas_euryale.AAC.10